MNRQPRILLSDQIRNAMDDLGVELLAGSGFEDETPDTEFRESEPADPSPPQ